MNIKVFAAVAAMCGVVASHGADLGKYMLPDADVMFASGGDSTRKCPYAKELESALAGMDTSKTVKDAFGDMNPEGAAAAEKALAYIDLLTNGVARCESALSLKATPAEGSPVPQIDLSAAVAGLKNLDKLFAKLAADFPKAVKLEGGALVPAEDCGVKAKAWVEDGVLRVGVGKFGGTAGAMPKIFANLLKKASGASYGGFRVKDPVGIAKRFMPAEAFAEMEKDEDLAEVAKLRNVAVDCEEDAVEPLLRLRVVLAFDKPETASTAAEKLIAFKQIGLKAMQQNDGESGLDKDTAAFAAKTLSAVKIAAEGPVVRVKAAFNAKEQSEFFKKLVSKK